MTARVAAILLTALATIAAVPPAAASGPAPNQAPGAPRGLGVDDSPTRLAVSGLPRFSWLVVDADPDEVQTAYQVRVSRTPNPADARDAVWDSGQIQSAQQTYVQYAGPALTADTTWYWTVRTWDHAGVPGPYAPAQRFDTGLGDGDWQAQWIRRRGALPTLLTPEDYSYLRNDVTLGRSRITRAIAYASASHHYELWINGARVDAGPSFSYPDAQYYQATDVTDTLRRGRLNAFGMLVHWYGAGQGRPAAEPGAILQVSIQHANGTHELVTTDGSWHAKPAPWLPAPPRNDEGERIERIDGRAEAVGWANAGFHDDGWELAQSLGRHPVQPWTHLVAQAPRVVEHAIRPVSLRKLDSGAYVADYGKVVAAVPTMRIEGGNAGRVVHLRAGYLLDRRGRVSKTHGTQGTDMSYEYTERDGAQTFRPLNYLGFRYLQVNDAVEALEPDDLIAYARHTRVPDEHAATFRSPNHMLERIFDLARHSALYGSQEQLVDTPTREKGQFLGDAAYTAYADQRAFGERALSRQALLAFASSQARYWADDGRVNAAEPTGEGARDIPDATEAFPAWVWQTYTETGDRALLATAYPVLAGISDYVARSIDPVTGLVTRLEGGGTDYRGGLVDYPFAMRYGYDMTTAARTTVNLLAVDVFRKTARIADLLGRPPLEIAAHTLRADRLATAINSQLRRPDGVYVDGLAPNGRRSRHASQHANAYALAFDVVPREDRTTVGGFVARQGMRMGPGTVLELLRALDVAGRDSDLVRILSDPTEPGWAQILRKGGTFTWESWKPLDALGDSMSHSRGAVVLVALQEELLGVRVHDPGWASFDVRPPTGGLSRASGVVPTPRGPVRVSWRRHSGVYVVKVTVPVNSTAVVHLPGESPTTLGSGTHVVVSEHALAPTSPTS